MEKTVVELFAGVGGFRVGLNRIKSFDQETGRAIETGNWNFVWANQWEPSTKVQHAFDCYALRFGDKHVSNEDISKVNKKSIPNHALLVGGFPCQDYSVARSKSTEQGIEGKKGVLFWEIAEILKAKETPFFLLENVDRLLKSPASQRGRDFGIMLRTVSDLGYNLEWRVVNAADYGMPQRRRRVFLFGWKRNSTYNKITKFNSKEILLENGLFQKAFPVEIVDNLSINEIDLRTFVDTVHMTDSFQYRFENSGVMIDGFVSTAKVEAISEPIKTLKSVLETNVDLTQHFLSEDKIQKFAQLRGGKRIQRTKPNGEIYFYSEGSMSDYDSLDLPSRTMLTSERSTNRSTHILMDPNANRLRYLTPVEAERLQEFPDNWTDSGMTLNRRYFMMGNALVTGIVSRLEPLLGDIIGNEIEF